MEGSEPIATKIINGVLLSICSIALSNRVKFAIASGIRLPQSNIKRLKLFKLIGHTTGRNPSIIGLPGAITLTFFFLKPLAVNLSRTATILHRDAFIKLHSQGSHSVPLNE